MQGFVSRKALGLDVLQKWLWYTVATTTTLFWTFVFGVYYLGRQLTSKNH